MKAWRTIMILNDAEEQIAYASKLLADLHGHTLKEWQYKSLKDALAKSELTLAKCWNELERIENENENPKADL